MENDKEPIDEMIETLQKEREPFIVFHAYPVEMWFWRIAVPVTLICSIIALVK